jgi:LysR family transcriptional regulator, glycine cleavage system transcriptional activator
VAQSRRRSSTRALQGLRRLPLGSLRVFVAAAQALSFSRAAEDLGVTTAAVSMQIRALEEYLRLPLFVRRGRNVQLTGEGARLLPRIQSALSELERALDEARQDRRSGALTVSMLSSFLQQWLLPRLPDFEHRHAQVDLRIHTSVAPVDFLNSDVQLAIRLGDGKWPQLSVHRLMDDWLVPVCTPRLLERHGPVATARDLERHKLLHGKSEPWETWIKGEDPVDWLELWAERGSTFDDSTALLRMAQIGQGLALARWSLVCGEVAQGQLVLASRRVVKMRRGYYLVCPPAYTQLEKLVIFREWILEQAKSYAPPPGAQRG